MCPACGKSLDDCPARDFIVFGVDHNPTSAATSDSCGWCDAEYTAQATGPDEITFKQKYC